LQPILKRTCAFLNLSLKLDIVSHAGSGKLQLRRRVMNTMRTAMLLAFMTALFMGVGYMIGGQGGMLIALMIAAGMNFFSYWNSDRMVLSAYHAQEVDERSAPEFFRMVRDLSANAGLPMPKV